MSLSTVNDGEDLALVTGLVEQTTITGFTGCLNVVDDDDSDLLPVLAKGRRLVVRLERVDSPRALARTQTHTTSASEDAKELNNNTDDDQEAAAFDLSRVKLEPEKLQYREHVKEEILSYPGKSNDPCKPYACQVCGKTFRLHSNRNTHRKRHSHEYECLECGKRYTSLPYLKTHLTIHSGLKPYQCEVCDASFNRPDVLNIHRRTHTGEKPFHCDQCSATFADKSTLRKHKKHHSEEKSHKCDQCKAAFYEPRQLREHMRIHTGERPEVCGICHKSFTRKEYLMRHIMLHTGVKPFKCGHCDMTFASKSNMHNHERSHSNVKEARCDICHKDFRDKHSLTKHKVLHTGIKNYRCTKCEAAFFRKTHLSSHMRVHTKEKPFKCDVCNKRLASKETLVQHSRIHTGEKPFKCQYCPKAFSQKNNCDVHMRVHTHEKPYQCAVCDARFTQHGQMKRHIMTIHEHLKPYKCNICNSAMSTKGALQSHMRRHTGEKPYKCNKCDRAFSLQGNLKTHSRIHLGIKPYKCMLCGAVFTQRTSLVVHERCHTGLKPYRCALCTAAFNSRGNLLIHHRVHTGARPYPCTLCSRAFASKYNLTVHMKVHRSVGRNGSSAKPRGKVIKPRPRLVTEIGFAPGRVVLRAPNKPGASSNLRKPLSMKSKPRRPDVLQGAHKHKGRACGKKHQTHRAGKMNSATPAPLKCALGSKHLPPGSKRKRNLSKPPKNSQKSTNKGKRIDVFGDIAQTHVSPDTLIAATPFKDPRIEFENLVSLSEVISIKEEPADTCDSAVSLEAVDAFENAQTSMGSQVKVEKTMENGEPWEVSTEGSGSNREIAQDSSDVPTIMNGHISNSNSPVASVASLERLQSITSKGQMHQRPLPAPRTDSPSAPNRATLQPVTDQLFLNDLTPLSNGGTRQVTESVDHVELDPCKSQSPARNGTEQIGICDRASLEAVPLAMWTNSMVKCHGEIEEENSAPRSTKGVEPNERIVISLIDYNQNS